MDALDLRLIRPISSAPFVRQHALERDNVGLTRRDCPGVFAGKERCAARSGATRKDRDADQRARPGNRKAAGAFWRMAASLVGHDAFSIAPLLVPRPAPKSAPSRWVKLTSSRSKPIPNQTLIQEN